MDAQAGMLARLFERSMGLGEEWEVSDVWFEAREGARDELRVRVARSRGKAARCPVCGRACGAHDSRERTWRHLDIWQYETIVHCAVPRPGCPEHGVRTARMPWEVRPNSHFTALFEAQVLVMARSGMTVSAISSHLGEPGHRLWRMLRRAVAEARESADYSGAVRVGIDDASRARGQSYISVMCDLDAGRVVAVTGGRDRGAPARPCAQLEAHGGDASAVAEVTRDMARAYSLGCADAMPGAAQTVDRFHVMQPLGRAVDRTRCAEARSSAEKRALLRGTKYCWLKRPENLTERQAARKGSLLGERLLTARACAMAEEMRAIYSLPTRLEASLALKSLVSWMRHSNVPEMKRAALTLREEREGILNWWSRSSTNALMEGVNSVIQSAKRAARGFRDIANFETIIYLRLGGLDFSAQTAALSASH